LATLHVAADLFPLVPSLLLVMVPYVVPVFSYEGQGEDPNLLGQQNLIVQTRMTETFHSIIIATCMVLTFMAKSQMELLLHVHMDARCGDVLH